MQKKKKKKTITHINISPNVQKCKKRTLQMSLKVCGETISLFRLLIFAFII